jgi:hypothetical protein
MKRFAEKEPRLILVTHRHMKRVPKRDENLCKQAALFARRRVCRSQLFYSGNWLLAIFHGWLIFKGCGFRFQYPNPL